MEYRLKVRNYAVIPWIISELYFYNKIDYGYILIRSKEIRTFSLNYIKSFNEVFEYIQRNESNFEEAEIIIETTALSSELNETIFKNYIEDKVDNLNKSVELLNKLWNIKDDHKCKSNIRTISSKD